MALSLLLGAALAAEPPQTGNALLDAFIADLAAGRRDAALASILEMNSISERPNAVAFADEFVEKLIGCTYLSAAARFPGDRIYDVAWQCRDGEYHALLDPSYRPPRIVVGEFISTAERDRRRSAPVAVPPPPYIASGSVPPPPPTVEQRSQIVARFVEALKGSGEVPPFPGSIAVRFADGRAAAYISAGQLRQVLAPCRMAGMHPEGRTTRVQWTCAGPNARGAEMTMQIDVPYDRVRGGWLWIGPSPDGQ